MSQEIFKAPNSKRIHQLILQRCHTSAEFRGFLGLKRLKNTFFDSRNIDFSLNPRIFFICQWHPWRKRPWGMVSEQKEENQAWLGFPQLLQRGPSVYTVRRNETGGAASVHTISAWLCGHHRITRRLLLQQHGA